jgi:hypothetical protein
MKVVYTSHAELKFRILEDHGVKITKSQVEDTVVRPDKVIKGKRGRLIAQKIMSEKHLLRVIYEKKENIEVITFYPARRKRYEGEI